MHYIKNIKNINYILIPRTILNKYIIGKKIMKLKT